MDKKRLFFFSILFFILIVSGYSGESEQTIKTKAIKIYKNEKGQKEVELKYGIKMVYIKGGEFLMGSPDKEGESDEHPKHKVYIDSFWIGKYEVTQNIWREIMGNNPSFFKGDKLPVEKVSWNDVQKFLKRLKEKTGLNFRLPTEAEWEYACKGGNLSKGFKYSGSNNADGVSWYWKNSEQKTHPVGLKNPNELGLYDMSGNVFEWCSDWYDGSYYSTSTYKNPKGPSSGFNRVDRGGGWMDDKANLRCSNREFWEPTGRFSILGFRLALSAKQ